MQGKTPFDAIGGQMRSYRAAQAVVEEFFREFRAGEELLTADGVVSR